MYWGRRTVGVYEPADTKSAMWSGSIVAADRGKEMAKAHDALDAQDAQAHAEDAQNRQMGMYQATHERNLQAAEQQRRQYDSETARMGQEKKYGLLGGLLKGF